MGWIEPWVLPGLSPPKLTSPVPSRSENASRTNGRTTRKLNAPDPPRNRTSPAKTWHNLDSLTRLHPSRRLSNMYICLHSCYVIVLDVFVLLLEDTVLIHRIRHDFPTGGGGNLQRYPQTLSFRVVRVALGCSRLALQCEGACWWGLECEGPRRVECRSQ